MTKFNIKNWVVCPDPKDYASSRSKQSWQNLAYRAENFMEQQLEKIFHHTEKLVDSSQQKF